MGIAQGQIMIKALILKIFGPIDYRYILPQVLGFMKELLWPATILVIAGIFRRDISKLIGRIKSVKYKDISVETVPSAVEALSISQKPLGTKVTNKTEWAIVELALLLSKYQFVWSAWSSRPEYCHAVRFSEKYAGGNLRYLNEYCTDLKTYDTKFGDVLPRKAKARFVELRSYLESVLPYHNTEEELTSPVFSRPKYLQLFGDLAQSLKNGN